MSNDILTKAKGLLGNATAQPRTLPGASALSTAKTVLSGRAIGSLDVYVMFDTTGSMGPYITTVREGAYEVTRELLQEGSDIRISMNGVGDHGDGSNWLQMYALSNDPAEIQGALDSIVMTHGDDEPEALECGALGLARRLPQESAGRKRAVIMISDSVPHGMIDEECAHAPRGYRGAFDAVRVLSDSFYFVGCNPQMYGIQRELIDATQPAKERFIPLGTMVDVLPSLLVALARKTESPAAMDNYLERLALREPAKAGAVRALLGTGQ